MATQRAQERIALEAELARARLQLSTARASVLAEVRERFGEGGLQSLRNLAEQADRNVSVTTAHIGYQGAYRAFLAFLTDSV